MVVRRRKLSKLHQGPIMRFEWQQTLFLVLVVVACAKIAPAQSRDPNYGRLDISSWTGQGHQVQLRETPSDLQPLLVGLILGAIPREYENDKKWGGTKEVSDGLHVKLDNFKIRTKRKKRRSTMGSGNDTASSWSIHKNI
jgi:hypothetical protein